MMKHLKNLHLRVKSNCLFKLYSFISSVQKFLLKITMNRL